MISRVVFVPIVLASLLGAGSRAADDFDRLEGRVLADLPGSQIATAHDQLTIKEIGALPIVLQGTRSALIVVVTDQGNPARLLVSPALRKPQAGGAEGDLIPILVVERFDTFEAGPATTKLARGNGLILFDGFRLDLDSGQVVPEGQGGDIQFVTEGKEGQRLVALSPSKLYTLTKSPLERSEERGKPSLGRNVLASDFEGRYRLFSNGQWAGTLDLKVGEAGVVTGRFQSEETGSSYRVAGQVGTGGPNQIQFSIIFPRVRQEFDGRLWTVGKGAMAGTMSLLEQSYGFFALREGGQFAPEGVDVGPLVADSRGAVVPTTIEISNDGSMRLDGKNLDETSLRDALKEIAGQDASRPIVIKAPESTPYRKVVGLVTLIHDAGLSRIQFSGADPSP